jgi:hypothetical protein
MAIYANLTIDQGSDYTTELQVEDVSGAPADLTGYTAAAEIRRSTRSNTMYPFTVSIQSPSVQGLITLKLPATVSNTMKPGRYSYDVEIKKTSTSDITRVIEGQVVISGGITRSI